MLVSSTPSLIVGATISLGNHFRYSAMAGTVGEADLRYRNPLRLYQMVQTDIMIVTVILLAILFQIFQTIGMKLASTLDRRK